MFGDAKPWQVYGEEDVKASQTPTIEDLTQEFTDDGTSPFTIKLLIAKKKLMVMVKGTPISQLLQKQL
jgi:hypothetical protein